MCFPYEDVYLILSVLLSDVLCYCNTILVLQYYTCSAILYLILSVLLSDVLMFCVTAIHVFSINPSFAWTAILYLWEA
ncbi:hypothetical protein Sjap_024336 [Stephania japonica]|uniref:Uncharacterized protein n=1 Tax=Stephania japonica TaxID=461633 RepID=A0AAP0EDE7_9MAGN